MTGLAASVALVTGAGGATKAASPGERLVIVRVDGTERDVTVTGAHPTVGVALGQAKVRPVGGHVVSITRHKVLGAGEAARVTLDGQPALAATPLLGIGDVIDVHQGADSLEPTFDQTVPLAPPAPPAVERSLWHPGSPGTAVRVIGVLSHETSTTETLVPPSAPAPVTDKVVALTFDDGPWPDTPQFVEVLVAMHVRATFCMVGRQVPARAAIVREVAAAGMTVCNHTLNHDEGLDRRSLSVIRRELQGGIDPQVAVLGRAPTLYRPPGGTLSPAIIDVAEHDGEQVIAWDLDSIDYRKPPPTVLVRRVLAEVRPGSIVLMHDGGGDRSRTLAALPAIIAGLRAQGYAFTTPDAVPPVATGAPAEPVPPATSTVGHVGPEG